MKKLVLTVALVASLAAVASAGASVRAAYFASWDIYARGYTPQQIPADKLNVIFYAFAKPALQPDGSVTCAPGDAWADYETPFLTSDVPDRSKPHVEGNFAELAKLKAAHPGLKLVMSIGGWTLSKYFSDAAATDASRKAFVASCVDEFINGNLPPGGWNELGGPGSAAGLFDGLDIDWEYPGIDPGNGADHSPADTHNATLLFQEFRQQLDATGKHYLLTAALPAGNVNAAQFELPAATRALDWVNLLTFDFHGSWDSITDINSPFSLDPFEPALAPPASKPTWNTVGTVVYYLLHGVRADKLVVGVPFYGKEYAGVPSANHGLYQPFTKPDASFNDSPTYHNLVDTGLVDPNLTPIGPTAVTGTGTKGLNGFTAYWDPFAGAPWLYNPDLNGGTFISYADPRAITERVALVHVANLRGLWAWEISQDDDAHDLLDAMTRG